jgi:hypothetical protein
MFILIGVMSFSVLGRHREDDAARHRDGAAHVKEMLAWRVGWGSYGI